MPVGTNSEPVRTTFPIPVWKLRLRMLKFITISPYTWGPVAAALAVLPFFDGNPAIMGGITVAVAAGVRFYWRKNSRKLSRQLLDDLISESNQVQDKELVLQARCLLKRGFPDYASTMGSFLERKQMIEKAIHSEGRLTREKQEIENLVDAVVFGVCDQLVRLANFDDRLKTPGAIPLTPLQREKIEAARQEIGVRVHEAFDIVEDTWENLGELIDPAAIAEPEDTSHPELENAIAKLREERAISKRVRTRMENDWGDQFGPAPDFMADDFGEEKLPDE